MHSLRTGLLVILVCVLAIACTPVSPVVSGARSLAGALNQAMYVPSDTPIEKQLQSMGLKCEIIKDFVDTTNYVDITQAKDFYYSTLYRCGDYDVYVVHRVLPAGRSPYATLFSFGGVYSYKHQLFASLASKSNVYYGGMLEGARYQVLGASSMVYSITPEEASLLFLPEKDKKVPLRQIEYLVAEIAPKAGVSFAKYVGQPKSALERLRMATNPQLGQLSLKTEFDPEKWSQEESALLQSLQNKSVVKSKYGRTTVLPYAYYSFLKLHVNLPSFMRYYEPDIASAVARTLNVFHKLNREEYQERFLKLLELIEKYQTNDKYITCEIYISDSCHKYVPLPEENQSGSIVNPRR